MDYGFLTGKTFAVNEDVFEVCEVSTLDTRAVVRAIDVSNGQLSGRTFPAEAVMAALVVDEEIELFPASFLGA